MGSSSSIEAGKQNCYQEDHDNGSYNQDIMIQNRSLDRLTDGWCIVLWKILGKGVSIDLKNVSNSEIYHWKKDSFS